MGLRDLVVVREDIVLPDGQKFSVRGLSIADVMLVSRLYGPQMATAFGKVTAAKGKLATGEVQTIIVSLVSEFPDMVAALVAAASDDMTPEAVQVAKSLPIPVQTQAVETVFALTFVSEGDMGKLVESLRRMAMALAATLTGVTAPSPVGIGDSAVN